MFLYSISFRFHYSVFKVQSPFRLVVSIETVVGLGGRKLLLNLSLEIFLPKSLWWAWDDVNFC
jgi:hypothetical protein